MHKHKNMEILIDYISWPMESIYKSEFHNFLCESLEPSSNEYFIRRMTTDFPEFPDYVAPDLPFYIGNVVIIDTILSKYSMEALTERAKAYSYTTMHSEKNHLIIFKPDHAPSGLPRDSYYIHISPVNNLDINGIRCKASGRFEPYEPRIYMFPLYAMVDSSLPHEDQYNSLMEKCAELGKRFNDRYLATGTISKPESYYVYLIQLPSNYAIYDDFSMKENSVYVENNIPKTMVRKVGFIEEP